MRFSSINVSYNLLTSTAWDDFYQTSTDKTYTHERSRLRGDESSYYVLFCRFINQNPNGAIYFTTLSKDTNFLAEDSLFSGCLNHGGGGSLFFVYDGQCVQNRICSLKSKISEKNDGGVHCWVAVSNTPPFQSKIIDSSISNSGDGKGTETIWCENGAINITSTNVSHSNTYAYQACYMFSINSDSFFQFSTFSNNSQTDTSRSCSYFYKASDSNANLNISSCNYLNNRNGSFLIHSHLPLYATNCNFENNDMKSYTFSQYSGKATFEKCYFDKTPTKYGDVTFVSNVFNKIDLNLHYFATFGCFREYEDSTIIIEDNIIETIPLIAHFVFPL